MADVKCIWDAKAVLGEGPLWVEAENSLYWVDVKSPAIHCLHTLTNEKNSWPMPEKIGCLVRRSNGEFLAALERGFVRIEFGVSGECPIITPLAQPLRNPVTNRFNDGMLDPAGRFIAGTMDDLETEKSGAWWRLDLDGVVRRIDPDAYMVTNGPAFDETRACIYLTDSAAQTIFVADYGVDGVVKNKRIFLQFGDGDGYPDGMTTDKNGNVWVAFWDGACVRKFSGSGKLLLTVSMPVPRPTSLVFNTAQNKLYVTSASIGLDGAALALAPLSGGVFVVENFA